MRDSSWKKILVSLCAGVLAGFAAPSHAAPGGYAITDLGFVKNTFERPIISQSARAFGLNDSSQVAGSSTFSYSPEGGTHVFVYNGGTMTDLGTLMHPMSEAHATGLSINNAGQIAGTSYIDFGGTFAIHHAFLYSGGTMRDLGTLGGRQSFAYAINNGGQVAGHSQATITPGGNPRADPAPFHAFLYCGGKMTDLGTLGGKNSYAYGINTSGDVVGESQTTGDAATRAFVYRSGRMVDLGTLGGTNSTAYGINDARYIVGSSDLPGNARSHAFLYDGVTMKDLGTLGGSTSVAKAINNAGQVVGTSRYTDVPYDPANPSTYTYPHAFLYDKGKMVDLNALPAVRRAGWVLEEATAINNMGQIVGYGHIKGQSGNRAFLLTPRERQARSGQ